MPRSFSFGIALLWLALPFTLWAAASSCAAQKDVPVEVVTQIGHSGTVTSVAFSPDGHLVLSGSDDAAVRLWDATSGQLLRSFSGHSFSVTSVAFSPDGRWVLSGGSDNTVKLWDAATGQLLRSFVGHLAGVWSVAFSPDGRSVLSGGSDKTTKLWDATSGKLLHTFEGHSNYVSSVTFSPDGRLVLSGSWDNTAKLWDATSGKLLHTFTGHSGPLHTVAFSPDGRWVLSGSSDNAVKLWDVSTGQLLRSLTGHSNGVTSVVFSPDGRSVLSGSWDDTINLWDANTGKLLRSFAAKHSRGVWSIALSPNGHTIVSGGDDAAAKLWDAATGVLLRTLERQSDRVTSVAYSPDGRLVLSGSWDKTAKLWDATTGKLLRQFVDHSGSVDSIAFSPDGRWVLSGSSDHAMKLWDATTGQKLRSFTGHLDWVTAVAFSRDGRSVLSGSSDKTVKLWDAATGALLRTFEGHSDQVTSVALSSDGRLVLSGSWDRTVKLWDATTGTLIRTLAGHAANVNSVAFSPDGRTVLSGSSDTTVKLWDTATGALLRTFVGHSHFVSSVTFSPDGRSVLTGSWDGTVRIWNAATGELLRNLDGHWGNVNSVAFSPDSRAVLSGGSDGAITLSSVSSGQLLARFMATPGGDSLAITPAGFFDFNGDTGNLVHLVRGFEVVSVAQTFDTLYRPDLVEALLKGDPEGKYKDAAYRLNLEKILASGPTPQIEHIEDKDDRAGDSLRMSIRVTGTGGGVGERIVWKVNGVAQGSPKPAALSSLDGPLVSAVITETLKLMPGQVNIVEVTAYNQAGLVATPPFKIAVDKFGTTTTDRPRMFVLALGVNDYRMKEYHLSYAAGDATSFGKALEVVGSTLFASVKSTVLTDNQVNETGVSSAIDAIAQAARPDDVFVLFLGGHGKSIAGQYYYYPQTLDFAANQSVEQNAIGQEKWEAWLRKLAVQKSLLVIDTCEGAAFRGSPSSDSVRQTAMNRLQAATGRNVIAAARDAAYEGYHGHGVLTYAILEALDATAASNGGDSEVRVGALADYVGRRVPEISLSNFGIEQNPTRKLSGNDFPIGIRRAVLVETGSDKKILTEPTHVLIRAALVRTKPESDAPGSQELTAGTQVREIEFSGAWAVIGRNGQKLGYVPADALAPLH